MFGFHKVIDFFINILRWPVAIILLLSIPALIDGYTHINYHSSNFYCLIGGISVYGFSALSLGNETRRAMQVIAHELTHTLFALLTFHSVAHIRLNPDGSGGSMGLKGTGNWIIILAPYFFPLFAFFYMLVFPWLVKAFEVDWMYYGILGYLTAYYWGTVISQVHLEQTDIIRCGYFFSGIIIVSMNLLVTALIFAYCNRMWTGVALYIKLIDKINMQNLQWLTGFIS